MRLPRLLAALFCAVVLLQAALNKPERQLTSLITANELRAHVSFLAADVLEGRDTPSRGLDVAAEYIASEFRRAGLEPLGDDGYFQTTTFKDAKVRNVAAILRGSDAKADERYIVVSAHYDHLGIDPKLEGDRIFNGANDDASGTASVLTLAEAFARLPQRPRRSILFLAFWGEEKGLVGSRYYVAHPLVPLARTIADFNLEHIGRTDDQDGAQLRKLSVTGFDYSSLTAWLQRAGGDTGVEIVERDKYSGPLFNASDNLSFARAGVPAHSICAAFYFPDYHKPGDEWPKLDYENMEAVVRTIAVAVERLADSRETVEWNADNKKTEKFVSAAKALRQ